MWYVAAVLLCNLSLLASGKLNYCGARMCSYTNAHTFCQFAVSALANRKKEKGGPGPQCIGYVETPLTTDEKIRLMIRLNQRRAAVANGRLRGFPIAGNMMKLFWIEELAREAQLWADQCEPPSTPEENDACRDLYSVAIGQCVASVIGEAPGLRPESMVDIWYMQNMFYRGNITSYDPPVNNRYNYYGDFAQLVYSKTYMVGCGRSRFMVLMSGRLRSVERLVCNFAPRGPTPGRPLWTVASPGTACPPRSIPDDNVPALCSVQRDLDETHDQDNMMSLEEHILLETVFEIDRNESLNYIGSLDEIFLTKVAAATMGHVVTTPIAYNTVPKRDSYELNDGTTTQTDDKQSSSETYKPSTKVVLVGRPKSYNIEELSEDDEDYDNDTQMQDLPIKENNFDVDYEFKETTEERRTGSAEKSTVNITFATMAVPTITTDYENKTLVSTTTTSVKYSVIKEETPSTLGVTPYSSKEVVDNIKENDTDALLEEYLSDPETVKRLQEELDRMEQALSTSSPKPQTQAVTSERAEKVRRALKDISVPDSDREQVPYDAYPQNSTAHVPQMLQMFSDDGNKSITNPMISMAMKYIPFFKSYKPDVLKNPFNSSNRIIVSYNLLVICILFNVF